MVFANSSPADIILKERLDSLQATHPNFKVCLQQFQPPLYNDPSYPISPFAAISPKVFFLVDKPPAEGWLGGVGYLTADVAKKALPPPATDTLILVRIPGRITGIGALRLIRDESPGRRLVTSGRVPCFVIGMGYPIRNYSNASDISKLAAQRVFFNT